MHWAQFVQGQKVSSKEPFMYCLGCNGTLQHASAFNVATTHMKSHLSSGKCHAAIGQKKEYIASMYEGIIIYSVRKYRLETHSIQRPRLPLQLPLH